MMCATILQYWCQLVVFSEIENDVEEVVEVVPELDRFHSSVGNGGHQDGVINTRFKRQLNEIIEKDADYQYSSTGDYPYDANHNVSERDSSNKMLLPRDPEVRYHCIITVRMHS